MDLVCFERIPDWAQISNRFVSSSMMRRRLLLLHPAFWAQFNGTKEESTNQATSQQQHYSSSRSCQVPFRIGKINTSYVFEFRHWTILKVSSKSWDAEKGVEPLRIQLMVARSKRIKLLSRRFGCCWRQMKGILPTRGLRMEIIGRQPTKKVLSMLTLRTILNASGSPETSVAIDDHYYIGNSTAQRPTRRNIVRCRSIHG